MQTVLTVEGMSCGHCEAAVKKAVTTLVGVSGVTVDLASKKVTVNHEDSVSAADIKDKIEEQGYDVV